MIMMRTMLTVADNSGARKIMCVRVLKGSNCKYGELGDVIVASVKEALPHAPIKKGTVVRALIVRTRKAKRRFDGSYIRFSDNAAVIIDAQGQPKGTRIFGPVAREVREKNFLKVVSLAPEVV